ncbi:MAG TPA: DUF4412 domain-containing protein [Polyangiaceae bacterium]|jgi:hypothetical protein
MRRLLPLALAVLGLGACKSNETPPEKTSPPPAPAAQETAATAAPGGGELFGSSFEGVIAMRSANAKGENPDLLFMVKGDKLRLDSDQDGKVAHSVFDGAAKKVTLILDSQKIAMALPLPSAPDAGPDAPTATVTKTGKHETIAGYDCEDWDVATGSRHESLCVASGVPFFDFAGTAALHAGPAKHTWADELRDKKSFPLRIIEKDPAGKELSRIEVSRIVKEPLEASAFEVPAGFHVMNMPGPGHAPAAPPSALPH